MDLLPFVIESDEQDYANINDSSGFSAFGVVQAMELLPTNPYQHLFKGFSSILLYFASTTCILFMLLGIPGNLFTIIALAKCKKVRNATAVFIINLSCSDLLFCCFNLPLAATTFYYREWVHGELMCRLFPLLRYGLLAVSLFTILTITINRYIMISHPRIYPRRRWLTLMVSLTWLCAFGTLIQTWRGKWGRFGMDTTIGSCSILPVEGKSPKQFLFVMAFILPCFAIVLCYARIFYIVRKTAMRTHDSQPRKNGSIRMNHNNHVNKTPPSPNEEKIQRVEKRKSICETNENNKNTRSTSSDEQRRKNLAKLKSEELKFIDTSCESDLPPTLSQLQRKSIQISNENIALSASPSTPTTFATTIISLEDNNVLQQQTQLNPINNLRINGENASLRMGKNLQATKTAKASIDIGVDSAVEDSTISLEQNVGHHLLSIPEPSSSSSGIEMPYDQETPKKKIKKATKSTNTKIKQKKIKDETPPPNGAVRKKSLVNTSGASIIYGAARMSTKDRRLLKMILVIFISFLTCYLPITLTKIMSSIANINFVFITSYLLVYLTTCINPIIYVVMSSEYRQAYKQLFTCYFGKSRGGANNNGNQRRNI